jgi:hypothetical protein
VASRNSRRISSAQKTFRDGSLPGAWGVTSFQERCIARDHDAYSPMMAKKISRRGLFSGLTDRCQAQENLSMELSKMYTRKVRRRFSLRE